MGRNPNQNQANAKSSDTVEVLYQKLGGKWFAFSLINDEVFVGSISARDIEKIENENAPGNPVYKITGNS